MDYPNLDGAAPWRRRPERATDRFDCDKTPDRCGHRRDTTNPTRKATATHRSSGDRCTETSEAVPMTGASSVGSTATPPAEGCSFTHGGGVHGFPASASARAWASY